MISNNPGPVDEDTCSDEVKEQSPRGTRVDIQQSRLDDRNSVQVESGPDTHEAVEAFRGETGNQFKALLIDILSDPDLKNARYRLQVERDRRIKECRDERLTGNRTDSEKNRMNPYLNDTRYRLHVEGKECRDEGLTGNRTDSVRNRMHRRALAELVVLMDAVDTLTAGQGSQREDPRRTTFDSLLKGAFIKGTRLGKPLLHAMLRKREQEKGVILHQLGTSQLVGHWNARLVENSREINEIRKILYGQKQVLKAPEKKENPIRVPSNKSTDEWLVDRKNAFREMLIDIVSGPDLEGAFRRLKTEIDKRQRDREALVKHLVSEMTGDPNTREVRVRFQIKHEVNLLCVTARDMFLDNEHQTDDLRALMFNRFVDKLLDKDPEYAIAVYKAMIRKRQEERKDLLVALSLSQHVGLLQARLEANASEVREIETRIGWKQAMRDLSQAWEEAVNTQFDTVKRKENFERLLDALERCPTPIFDQEINLAVTIRGQELGDLRAEIEELQTTVEDDTPDSLRQRMDRIGMLEALEAEVVRELLVLDARISLHNGLTSGG